MKFDASKCLPAKITEIKPSGIRKFFDMLGGMTDVIALTVGQPDFVTPWHIREAAIESIRNGETAYTSNAGSPELRENIAKYMDVRFSLSYDPMKEIIVTVGASEAIDLAMRDPINAVKGFALSKIKLLGADKK